MARLWGAETDKAIANFPVSGEPVPAAVIRWLGLIKAAAAHVNAELGQLDGDLAERIEGAARSIAAGEHDDQFPVDVFQTGSGTSTNMNANEVIAQLAGTDVHPNDHVNLGQSSNDVFPTAVHLAIVEHTTEVLLPSLDRLATSLREKAAEYDDAVKAGRTHLMDAVPVTLGQELGGHAAQIALGMGRIGGTLARVAQVPIGGTAVGTGLNTHPEFAVRVRDLLAAETGVPASAPADRFEAQASRDALVELSGAHKVLAVSLTKIATDIAWMSSGPRCGLGELELPELQKGSSIMPGKVNPVIPEVVLQVAAQVIGNDTAITIAGSQGNFELNVRVPVIARNLFDSSTLLAAAATLFADRCISGMTANLERLTWTAEHTLAAATALNPVVGYDEATGIVRLAVSDGISLAEAGRRRGVDPDALAAALDPRRLAAGNG